MKKVKKTKASKASAISAVPGILVPERKERTVAKTAKIVMAPVEDTGAKPKCIQQLEALITSRGFKNVDSDMPSFLRRIPVR